jgi:hypothetical protein
MREKLAEACLSLAHEVLQDLKAARGEASVKDLIAIFQASVKTHRDLTADAEKSKQGAPAAPAVHTDEYGSKVQEILERFR